ncbi:reverse transcriptase domain-containing protein, partial [Shewanella sp. 125m-1]
SSLRLHRSILRAVYLISVYKFIKPQYVDKGLFYKTAERTPQGGIISPTLMLLTLAGLELLVKFIACKTGNRVNFIGYADDFVITGSSKEVLANEIKPQLIGFLQERGLTLSDEKTHITHIDDGFDFLGALLPKSKEPFGRSVI